MCLRFTLIFASGGPRSRRRASEGLGLLPPRLHCRVTLHAAAHALDASDSRCGTATSPTLLLGLTTLTSKSLLLIQLSPLAFNDPVNSNSVYIDRISKYRLLLSHTAGELVNAHYT